MSAELARRADVRLEPWSAEQLAIIKRTVAPGCSDDELAFFAEVAAHKQLDPFAGEIVAVMRWSTKAQRKVMSIQETVAGLRAIAQRTGLYAGQDQPLWCGRDGVWHEVWLDSTPPAAAKVAVYRKDWDRPVIGIATYVEFVQLDDRGQPESLWRTHPTVMLAKTSERQAMIRAFSSHMARAGVNTTELSAPSRVSMEARHAGLDDDGRHGLVAGVTAGRTNSTRELTLDEVLEVRAEIARVRGERTFDPATGEIVDPRCDSSPAPVSTRRTITAVGPGHRTQQTTVDHEPPARGPAVTEATTPTAPGAPLATPSAGGLDPGLGSSDAGRLELLARLSKVAQTLSDKGRANLHAWLDEVGIGKQRPVKDYSTDELHAVDAYFEATYGEPF